MAINSMRHFPWGCRLVPRARTDGRWAESTPTSSSSKLNRIGRKGDQIRRRARGPYVNFERPLDDRPPGKALFWLGNKRTTVIVQPGIRLHEGSARAARLFDEKRREQGREKGVGVSGRELGTLVPPPNGWPQLTNEVMCTSRCSSSRNLEPGVDRSATHRNIPGMTRTVISRQ